jgi:hypothetical protein
MNRFNEILRKGVALPMNNSVISIDENRYMERYLLKVDETHVLVYNIFDKYTDEICYANEWIQFSSLDDAIRVYGTLGDPA